MSRRRVRSLVGTLGDKVCVSYFLQKTNIKVYELQINELVLQTRVSENILSLVFNKVFK